MGFRQFSTSRTRAWRQKSQGSERHGESKFGVPIVVAGSGRRVEVVRLWLNHVVFSALKFGEEMWLLQEKRHLTEVGCQGFRPCASRSDKQPQSLYTRINHDNTCMHRLSTHPASIYSQDFAAHICACSACKIDNAALEVLRASPSACGYPL